MRFSFVLPFLLSAAAFVLSLLVLLAGKDPNFLTSIYILKIDSSDIKPSKNLITTGLNLPTSITNILNNLPQDELNRLAQTTAKKLGLRDFYTAHVMTYCEGFEFLTSGTSSLNSNVTEDKTIYCSNPKAMFKFDPISIFSTQLVSGVTIDDLGIPQDAKTSIEAVGVAYKIMFLAYAIGIALTGIVLILTFLSGWFESRLVAFFIGLLSFPSLLALGVASGIGTAIATKLRDAFNKYMVPELNIYASSSAGYLGMTWAAVACLIVVVVYWAGACCCGAGRRERKSRRRRRESGEDGLIGNGAVRSSSEMKEAPRYG